MIYRLPLLCPSALAGPDMPPLRGQRALRISAIQDLARDAPPRLRAFDAVRDADLLRPLPPLCGLALDRPLIMGILNVTPDSFSDGGQFAEAPTAMAQARHMVEKGADLLDIGGESTRPGAQDVPVADEIARTAPLIRALRDEGVRVPISIDTRKAAVARAALEAGADMVNDVSALSWDCDMALLVAEAGVPLCLMHAQGTPQTMQKNPHYEDVKLDVREWLDNAVMRAEAAGINRNRLIIDPGIGFGKTCAHNLALLRSLGLLHEIGCAILLGASRKRFIGTLTGVDAARDRVAGSLAVALQGAAQGAQILRVHDVGETRQALQMWLALNIKENGAVA